MVGLPTPQDGDIGPSCPYVYNHVVVPSHLVFVLVPSSVSSPVDARGTTADPWRGQELYHSLGSA